MKKNLLNIKKNLLTTSLILASTLSALNSNKKIVSANSLDTVKMVIDKNNAPKTMDEAIKYYCDVFELKFDVINNKINEIINPYAWHYATNINGTSYESVEQAILITIRDIYNYPEDYGLIYEEINSGIAYEPSMKPEEMIYKYSNIYGINKDIALAIAYCECGTDMGSYNYLENNNPAGIGPYYHFLNKEVGIIYFCNMLKNGYNCTKDSDVYFLNSIASTYCEIPDHWLDLTVPLYNNISSNYLYYVYDENDYDVNDYEDTYELPLINIKRHKLK